MEDSNGQVSFDAAAIYEREFVPALFSEWPERLLAEVPGEVPERLLDVACGTGILARAARRRFPSAGVYGLDRNPGMLRVAQGLDRETRWIEARAEELPFPDEHFDLVFCQFGLMFMDEPERALEEMVRVLRPEGTAVIAVWDAIDRSPGYREMSALLNRLFGPSVAEELKAPYRLGEPNRLRGLLDVAYPGRFSIERRSGRASFPSLRDWVRTEIFGWTLADRLSPSQVEVLVSTVERELRDLETKEGRVEFAHDALLARLRK